LHHSRAAGVCQGLLNGVVSRTLTCFRSKESPSRGSLEFKLSLMLVGSLDSVTKHAILLGNSPMNMD
ncbi:hypothetical protein TorRG33x02_156070, partial [Trema orientale]